MNFVYTSSVLKQGLLCELILLWRVFRPRQGNKIKVAVLNRVYILGIGCLKQGQGQLNYTQKLVEHPHPSPGLILCWARKTTLKNDAFPLRPCFSLLTGSRPDKAY